ncbi:MAG: DUF4870 domain-containing protein [Draconibacterium sp.]
MSKQNLAKNIRELRTRKGLSQELLAENVLNFQITWTIVLLLTYIWLIGSTYYRLHQSGDVSLSILGNPVYKIVAIGGLYLYNFVLVVSNTFRINQGYEARYLPKIRFVR